MRKAEVKQVNDLNKKGQKALGEHKSNLEAFYSQMNYMRALSKYIGGRK